MAQGISLLLWLLERQQGKKQAAGDARQMDFMGDILGVPDRRKPTPQPTMRPGPRKPPGMAVSKGPIPRGEARSDRMPQGQMATSPIPQGLSKEQMMAKHIADPQVRQQGMQLLSMIRGEDAENNRRLQWKKTHELAGTREERLQQDPPKTYSKAATWVDDNNVNWVMYANTKDPEDRISFPAGRGKIKTSGTVDLPDGKKGVIQSTTQGKVFVKEVPGLKEGTWDIMYFSPEMNAYVKAALPVNEAKKILTENPRSLKAIYSHQEWRGETTTVTPSGQPLYEKMTTRQINNRLETRRLISPGIYTFQTGRLGPAPKVEMKASQAVSKFVQLNSALVTAKASGTYGEQLLKDLISYQPAFAAYLKAFDYERMEEAVHAEMKGLLEFMTDTDKITYGRILAKQTGKDTEYNKFMKRWGATRGISPGINPAEMKAMDIEAQKHPSIKTE